MQKIHGMDARTEECSRDKGPRLDKVPNYREVNSGISSLPGSGLDV